MIEIKNIWERYLRNRSSGWLEQEAPLAAAKFAAINPTPMLSVSAPWLMDRDLPKDVFLLHWYARAMRERHGNNWIYKPNFQWRGTCVGQGYSMAGSIVMAISRFLTGGKFPGKASVAAAYAFSRVEVGGWVGNQDGSTGSWAAQAMTDYGIVTLEELGLQDDDIKGDEQLAVKWAASRQGVPAELEATAKERPVKGATMVLTPEEVRASLAAGKPVPVCSTRHASQQRNSQGISTGCSRGGGHCELVCGYKLLSDGTYVYDELNSWGNYYRGGYARTDDPIDKAFSGSVKQITESCLRSKLASRDCYSLYGVEGLDAIDNYL